VNEEEPFTEGGAVEFLPGFPGYPEVIAYRGPRGVGVQQGAVLTFLGQAIESLQNLLLEDSPGVTDALARGQLGK
jgi:hypothetical protein